MHSAPFPVLVVEDDVAIRGLATHVLRSKGYTVLEAASAEVALVVLGTLDRGVTPVVLLDKCLPGMTGLDMLERSSGLVEDLEVILATAFCDREALLRGMELGVSRCLTKPFHIEELLAAVQQATARLEKRRASRAESEDLEKRAAELERRLLEKESARAWRTAPNAPGSLPAGLRLLFIDDDPLVQRAYARLFRRQIVQVAPSAAYALERIPNDPPDVIVCDLHMPDMDGLTFYEQLEARAPHLASRVVFVSGADLPGPRSSRIVPKVPIVRKPFAAAELEGTVLALLAS